MSHCEQCKSRLHGECLAEDGAVFCNRTCLNKHFAAKRGYVHACPICHGTGREHDRYVGDVETYDPSGGCDGWFSSLQHRAVVRREIKRCEFCEGRGFLKQKPTPVVEPARVTGWRK